MSLKPRRCARSREHKGAHTLHAHKSTIHCHCFVDIRMGLIGVCPNSLRASTGSLRGPEFLDWLSEMASVIFTSGYLLRYSFALPVNGCLRTVLHGADGTSGRIERPS